MATMYDPYKNNVNKKTSERREPTHKPQTYETPVKNKLDNSDSILYNKDKENTGFKSPSVVTDSAQRWKKKNQGVLKYAGDETKKSVDAGLKEAPSFMQDADEGTSFDKIQDTAVKWRLAVDAQDDKLYKSAVNEMIGHLSSVNKVPYLKGAQPLQKYIDSKDEFDYKHNNYTTTENVDKTPDENVRQLQRELNEAGYTDKFGKKLKEDGVYAGKTAYADDSRRADNTNIASNSITDNNRYKTATINGKEYQVEYLTATKDDLQPKMLDSSEVKLASANYDAQLTNSRNRATRMNTDTYYNSNGILKWRELPPVETRIPVETKLYKQGKITKELYEAFDTLSKRWYYADTKLGRKEISDLAKMVRDNNYEFTDCTDDANNQLWENGQTMLELSEGAFSLPSAGIEWYNLVNNDCKWDYKKSPADWMPKEKYFMFYGQLISFADFGNINYGYTGTVLGLSPETLYKGAGYVQTGEISDNPYEYYGDAEVDYQNVKKGIEWANKKGYKGNLDLPLKLLFGIMD